MPTNTNLLNVRTAYSVWDRTTRWFHWINFICVLLLSVLGLAILNEKSFEVSADGKILLKTLHTYVGYVLAINLTWRMIWGFLGNTHARWKAIIPFRPGYVNALGEYVRGFLRGSAPNYVGHNPVGRIMVSLLLILLLTQSATGLIIAGTDLYMPPFGGLIADWVTNGDPDKLAQLLPGSKDHVDPVAYDAMRSFRSPIVTTHLYAFYSLMFAIFVHVAGVVITEIREKNGLVSAMFSGEKSLPAPPVDDAEDGLNDKIG